MMEITLAMFEPRSLRLDMSYGSGILSRDQIVAVIGIASQGNEIGWQATRAMHSNDALSVSYVRRHLSRALAAHSTHCAELPDMALSALLGRPIGDQLNALIYSHPLWDRERRRAAKVKVLIDKAISSEKGHEAQRLTNLHAEILNAARARCKREILETGRCPRCLGTGRMIRKDAECGGCRATGRIIPDMQVIEKATNSDALRAVHSALDDIGSACAKFSRDMTARLQAEREAFDC